MNRFIFPLVVILLFYVAPTSARNDIKDFPVSNLMALEAYSQKLSGKVKFLFGDAQGHAVVQTFGQWPSVKKTNAFNKSDEYACQWAMLSALVSLERRALSEGGNAVIVVTNNNHIEKISTDTFECEVGNVVASVALLGTVIKI